MNIVVLLSGGSGTRMCGSLPKQHIMADNHQIIEYTLTAFSMSKYVDAIIVVSNPAYISYVHELKGTFEKLKWVIEGGDTRIQSVENAVGFLSDFCLPKDKIIFSDAVRPCVTLKEIENLVNSLDTYVAATTGVEVYETVLTLCNDTISTIIPREGVVRQTSPEGYLFGTLEQLYTHEKANTISQYRNIGIDQLYAQGVPVGVVKSNPLNFKITLPEDIYLFEAVLKQGFEKIICGR